jgi:predicted PurR-regulated permease PerM
MAIDLSARSSLTNGPLSAERTIVRAITILAVLGMIAALYIGRTLFVPLAVAILLTFVLAPLVRLLRRLGADRISSVVIVVVFAFTIIFGFGALLGQQATSLAERLPQYQFNIQQKIQSAREAATRGKTFERIAEFLRGVNNAIVSRDAPSVPAAQPSGEDIHPAPVEIHQPPPTPIEIIRRVLDPLAEPLTTIGVIVIFVIFFLFQREDLRDRLIKLAGSYDIKRTTEAINDAARRLSRYFLAQTALNIAFGLIIATGLLVIGVPNPILWGIMAALLRFVPYMGAFIAAVCPIALSIAVDPGWTMALWTAALFLAVEPLVGQVVEPLVYGRSTGISAVAVVLAATFWTWLWGPIGLLLSTPLTVCLGVLGRHIEWLRFIDVMIGDDPPLTPAQSFYQRALAADLNETLVQCERYLKDHRLVDYYDDVVLPALLLAQIDARRGALDERHIAQINDVLVAVIAELADHADEPRAGEPDRNGNGTRSGNGMPEETERRPVRLPNPEDLAPGSAGKAALCFAGPGPFDTSIAMILTQLLEKHGVAARSGAEHAVSALDIGRAQAEDAGIIGLSYLYLGHSPAHLGYTVRRLRRRMPHRPIIAGVWCHEPNEPVADLLADELGAGAVPNHVATTMRQAVEACIAIITSPRAKTDTAA